MSYYSTIIFPYFPIIVPLKGHFMVILNAIAKAPLVAVRPASARPGEDPKRSGKHLSFFRESVRG